MHDLWLFGFVLPLCFLGQRDSLGQRLDFCLGFCLFQLQLVYLIFEMRVCLLQIAKLSGNCNPIGNKAEKLELDQCQSDLTHDSKIGSILEAHPYHHPWYREPRVDTGRNDEGSPSRIGPEKSH